MRPGILGCYSVLLVIVLLLLWPFRAHLAEAEAAAAAATRLVSATLAPGDRSVRRIATHAVERLWYGH